MFLIGFIQYFSQDEIIAMTTMMNCFFGMFGQQKTTGFIPNQNQYLFLDSFFLALIKKREECRTTTESQLPASGRCYAVKPSFVFTIMLCFMRYCFLIMQLLVFLLSESLLISKPIPYVLISFLAWRNDLFFREIFYFETRTQILFPPLLSPCQ